MNTLLEGRTIIVTGAARGIGQAYCKALHEAGAVVVAADILEVDETVAMLGNQGMGVKVDVTDMASCQAMVDAAKKAYGRIDGIINNAAIYGPSKMSEGARVWPFDEIPEESWQRMFNVNVAGMWRCCKAVAPVMRSQGYGKIVNIGSTSVALGAANLLHYVASKGAVLAMTRVLARELGPSGIRVNTLAPGFTQSQASKDILREGHIEFLTDVIKANCALGREQEPEDLVGTAVYLLSPLSDFVTGQVLVPDGGVNFSGI
jgi:3-oxoacyl-[acyl-carrier protein] reductase